MLPYCFRRFGKSSVERSHRIGCRAWHPRLSGRLRLEVLEDRLAPAVHVWTGGGTSNNWSNTANWSGGTPAGDTAAILIFSGTQRTTNTDDLTSLTIQSITFYAPFTISGNAMTLSGGLTTDASMSGIVSFGPDITLSGSPTITVGNSSSTLTLQGMLSGTAGFTKEGDGTLIVQHSGTYTGTTTLTAGTLEPGASSLGTGTVALDGGTLGLVEDFTSPFTVGDASHQGVTATIQVGRVIHITGNGILSQYGTLEVSNNSNFYFDGNLRGSGPMLFNARNIATIDGDNSAYSGTVTITGNFLTVGRASSLGTGPLILTDARLQAGAPLALANPFLVATGGAIISGTENFAFTGPGFLSLPSTTLTVGNTAGVVSLGILSGPGALNRGFGAGTLLLTAACIYTGPTGILGGTLQLGVPNALPSGGAVAVDAGGVLDLQNQDITIGALNNDRQFGNGGSIFLGTGTLTTSGFGAIFSGTIRGTGALVKTGDGRFTLSGANTYTGATIVEGGTLQIGTANALPSSTAVSLAFGTTLDLNYHDATIGSLEGAGSVTLGTGTLTTGGLNASTTFSGSISGSGRLTKNGTGTFTLASANSFMGATTINAGTLLLTGTNALQNTSAIVVTTAGTLNIAGGSDIIAHSLTGAGGVTVSGTQAIVIIQGTYSVTGPTIITDGTVFFNSTTPGTMQTLLINGGSLQVQQFDNLNATTATLSSGELGGKGTFTIGNNGHLYWSGGIMDDSGMTMILPGSELDLSGSGNRYESNGRQVCNAGNVVWSGSGGVWWTDENASIHNESMGRFDFNAGTNARFGSTLGGAFLNDGAIVQHSTTGTTMFDAGVTFSNSGTVDVQSGTLSLGAGTSSTAFSVETGATLNFAGGTFTASAISGAGTVGFNGGATIVQTYSVSGLTSVAGGAVTFNQNVTLANLMVSSGSITIPSMVNLSISQLFTWNGGTLNGPGTITNLVQLNLSGAGDKVLAQGGTLNNAGTITWTDGGGLALRTGATFINQIGALLDAQSDAALSWDGSTGVTFTNAGTFRKSGGGAGATVVNVPFTNFDAGINHGTIDLQTGTLSIPGQFTNFSSGTLTGGAYLIAGILQFNQAAIQTNAAQITLNGPGAQITDLTGNNDALAALATNALGSGFSLQNGAVYTTSAGFYNAGTLTLGAGSILTVNGDYTQDLNGTLSLQFGGSPSSGQFGQLAITGDANLDGTLTASLVPGFILQLSDVGDRYTVMTFAAQIGPGFATENLDLGGGFQFRSAYDDNDFTLTVTSTGDRPQQRFAEHRETAPVPRIGDGLSGVPWDRNPGRHDGRYGRGNAEVSTRASAEDLDALFACPQQNTPADDGVGNLVHSPFRIHQVIDTSNWSSWRPRVAGTQA